MKILLLGTSNSLLSNGFCSGLSKVKGVFVENLSIGASPGLQFTALANKDFSLYDFVIFDSLPNDEEYYFLRNRYFGSEYNRNILFEIFSIINSQSKLIILNIPIRMFNNPDDSLNEDKSSFQRSRELLSNKVGAQTINVDDLINVAEGILGVSRFNFYKDRQHPHDFLMKKIGEILATTLASNLKLNLFFSKDRLTNFSYRYKNVSPDEIFESRYVYRKNSLLEDIFYIPEGNSLDFRSFDQLKLIGFYCNVVKSNCFLHIKKNNGDSYSIRVGGNNRGELMKIFIPMPEGDCVSFIEISDQKRDEKNYSPLRCDSSGGNVGNIVKPEFGEFVFRSDDKFNWDDLAFDDSFNEFKLNSILIKKFISYLEGNRERYNGATITSYSGSSIFFNVARNKFMLLNKHLCFLAEEELLPVLIESVDDRRAKLYIERGGVKYFISVLSNKLFLEDDAVTNIENSIFQIHKSGFFISIKSGDNYLRAIFSETYDCLYFDRTKVGVCEKFSLIN